MGKIVLLSLIFAVILFFSYRYCLLEKRVRKLESITGAKKLVCKERW